MRTWLAAFILLSSGSVRVAADTPAASPALTLARVFASPELGGQQPRGLKLSPDGTLVTVLRPRENDRNRYDLWAIDTRTGQARMLVDSEKVGSGAALSEEEKMRRERLRISELRGITAYDWSPDSKSILAPLDGDLYLATLDGSVRRLTNTPQTEIEPHVSNTGRFVSFVRDHNLFVLDLTTGQERQTTTGGGETLSWGAAEFIAQEELDRFSGQWWSPDDRRIAIQRTDESGVQVVRRAAIGASGTSIVDQRYPAAGTPNAEVELWLMNPDGSGQVRADLGANPDFYLARVSWAPDGAALYVQRLARDNKRLDLLKVDPRTGASTVLFSETSPTWVNVNDNFRPLRDGSLIWASERSGYMHLYRWNRGRWTALTHGDWSLEMNAQATINGLIGVDEAHHRLFFTGNKDDVLESQIYVVDYLHPGEPKRVSERGYWNTATMNRNADRLLITRSGPDQPPQTYLADTEGHRLTWINENAIVPGHPYHPYLASHRPTRFGTLKAADGSTLHWKMITPSLEPGKRYPVFMEHYGGPGSQEVTRRWGKPLSQYIVSQGWVYFEIDNRGSPNRGRKFEDQIYHAMGTVEVEDQVAAANWLKQQQFVDPAKVATYGWSYGGYMALKLLQKAAGVFAAGVAGAPVTRWELYDTAYTERYLGGPRSDPESYRSSDALQDTAAIRDPLLLLHGMSDDNVVLQHSTEFAAKMQAENRPFEMMFYPGKTHTAASDIHVWSTIMAFLNDRVRDRR